LQGKGECLASPASLLLADKCTAPTQTAAHLNVQPRCALVPARQGAQFASQRQLALRLVVPRCQQRSLRAAGAAGPAGKHRHAFDALGQQKGCINAAPAAVLLQG
jgi:hypothetical protein